MARPGPGPRLGLLHISASELSIVDFYFLLFDATFVQMFYEQAQTFYIYTYFLTTFLKVWITKKYKRTSILMI